MSNIPSNTSTQQKAMAPRRILIASCITFGLVGIALSFAPDEISSFLGLSLTSSLIVLLQLLGALYLAIAMMNWTAKESIIGGVYARPITIGNFTHCLIGALSLIKYQLAGPALPILSILLLLYIIFAISFGWLVFVARGIR